jgi:hypothetical protein
VHGCDLPSTAGGAGISLTGFDWHTRCLVTWPMWEAGRPVGAASSCQHGWKGWLRIEGSGPAAAWRAGLVLATWGRTPWRLVAVQRLALQETAGGVPPQWCCSAQPPSCGWACATATHIKPKKQNKKNNHVPFGLHVGSAGVLWVWCLSGGGDVAGLVGCPSGVWPCQGQWECLLGLGGGV